VRGNLAPRRAVLKPASASEALLQHEGPAMNFIACYLLRTGRDDEEKASERIADEANAISRKIHPSALSTSTARRMLRATMGL